MLRKICFVLLTIACIGLLLAGAGADDPVIGIYGNITTNANWNRTDMSYQLNTDISVEAGAKLTIGSNARLEGNGHKITVYGTLEITSANVQNTYIVTGKNTMQEPASVVMKSSRFSGGALFNPTGNETYAHIELRNNTISNTADYMYIWYPIDDTYILGNTFNNCGCISIGSRNDVFIYQNTFNGRGGASYKDAIIENWAQYNDSHCYVRYNVFDYEGTVLSLQPGHSSANMVADNNNWRTNDIPTIESRIYDYKDDVSCAGIIEYLPIVKEDEPTLAIPIDADHFPDPDFREYVAGMFDKNGNGSLSDEERTKVTSISMDTGSGGVRSLQGIEYFPNLSAIYIIDQPYLTEADLSHNAQIAAVELFNVGLTEVDISSCPVLREMVSGNEPEVVKYGDEAYWYHAWRSSAGHIYADMRIEFLPDGEETIVASGKCGANIEWTLNRAGLLALTGSGPIPGGGLQSWYDYREQILAIEIGEGITEVGDYAMSWLEQAEKVTLPETMKRIGKEAFGFCASLAEINFPKALTVLDDYAFVCCTPLTITQPEDVSSNDYLRCYNGVMVYITVPETVTELGNAVFLDMESEERTYLKNVGRKAGIQPTLTLPAGTVEEEAFTGMPATFAAFTGSGTITIGEYAFAECSKLRYVMVTEPQTHVEIAENAFDGCDSDLVFIGITEDGVSEMEDYAIEHGFGYMENEQYLGNG